MKPRLYNTIAVFDVYTIATTGEAATEALKAWIAEGSSPSELVAVESLREGSIRQAWRDQSPLVAADVTDLDFARFKGKTTAQIFQMLYTKEKP
jgi:hypothetical protein